MLDFNIAHAEIRCTGQVQFDQFIVMVMADFTLLIKDHAGFVTRFAGRPLGQAGVVGVAVFGEIDPCREHLMFQLVRNTRLVADRYQFSIVEDKRDFRAVPGACAFVDREVKGKEVGIGRRLSIFGLLGDKPFGRCAESGVQRHQIAQVLSRVGFPEQLDQFACLSSP